jgi:hypothetical protein
MNNHACELAQPTAGIAALTFLETAATCRICQPADDLVSHGLFGRHKAAPASGTIWKLS